MELAPDYRYAVNGEPKREYLWLLSLTPKMDAAVYEKFLAGAAAQGFDVSKVQKTAQTE